MQFTRKAKAHLMTTLATVTPDNNKKESFKHTKTKKRSRENIRYYLE